MKLRKSIFAGALMLSSWGPCHAAELMTRTLFTVHQFFDALAQRDKPGMLAVVAPDLEITSMIQGKLHRQSIGSLTDAIAAHHGGAIAEHIYNPVVHNSDDLAVVWAPYKFTIDGKVDHCGIDVITLGLFDNRWLIIGLSDSERKENCQ